MKNTIKFILISLFILAQLGCSEKSSTENITTELNEELKLKKPLNELGCEIESKDSIRIKNISTDKGYASLLSWSDSLRSDSFINDLSRLMKNYNVFEITKWNDSMLAVSLGKSDQILGATGGYLVLKEINNELKIDEFRGGE